MIGFGKPWCVWERLSAQINTWNPPADCAQLLSSSTTLANCSSLITYKLWPSRCQFTWIYPLPLWWVFCRYIWICFVNKIHPPIHNSQEPLFILTFRKAGFTEIELSQWLPRWDLKNDFFFFLNINSFWYCSVLANSNKQIDFPNT